MTYPDLAADVRGLIRSEGLGHPTVIGHSMGGKTAMTLALESPESVGPTIKARAHPPTPAVALRIFVA